MFAREPMLAITSAYVFVSIIGLWDSYWFYRRFDVPILEYMHTSDYFVAGLKRPIFAVALAAVLAMAALSLWPDRWIMRNQERAAHLRETTWWGRMLLPRRFDRFGYGGMHPETATALTAVVSIVLLLFLATNTRANRVERGGGHVVSVILAGESSPVAGSFRLLGTSSAFVFLWNVDQAEPEVLPIQSIQRISIGGLSAVSTPEAMDSTGPAKRKVPQPTRLERTRSNGFF